MRFIVWPAISNVCSDLGLLMKPTSDNSQAGFSELHAQPTSAVV